MVTMTGRLFVTGAAGQLGTAVRQVAARGDSILDVTPLTSTDLDIADSESVRSALTDLTADDVVLNCIAYTDVDGAEEDHSGAHAVNVDGPAHLVRVTKEKGAWLIHISTDYVFSGTPPRVADIEGYEPGDIDPREKPATVYGRTKLRGENVVLRNDPSSTIVRTAWLYTGGPESKDFVGTMHRLEAQRVTISVVDDQTGSPTYAHDLAAGLLELAGRGWTDAVAGQVLHATNAGRATWYELAAQVFTEIGADPARVQPCTTADFPRPAPRPAYSVLSGRSWAAAGLTPLRDWRTALGSAVAGQDSPVDHT